MSPVQSEEALRCYNEFVLAEDAGRVEEAREKLRKSARLGEPMAFHVLAYYEFQKSCPRVGWALKYYRKAALQGFAPSAWNLARYYEGRGKTHLYAKWMKCAASFGDPEARIELEDRGLYELPNPGREVISSRTST